MTNRESTEGTNPSEAETVAAVPDFSSIDSIGDTSAEAPPTPTTHHHDDVPDTIGDYTIECIIGEGGMGTVYLARQRNPDRAVALKLIRLGYATRKILRRFELEAQLLGRLQHQGIAQIYEAGTFETARGSQPYFAMELVEGEPLDRYITENALGTRARLELLAKIADAVQHAHEKGIVHRDLKPGNILVTEDGLPKILDFGVARATDSDIQVTTIQTDVGQLIGTVPYMSPEQITGDPTEIDVRSDVYALGVVLYELLAGRLPYDLTQRMIHEAARVIREDDPAPLSSINKTLRGDVETIVAKALEKEKSRRYQSAAELADDIRRHLDDKPIVARAPSTIYQLRKFARRNKALVGGVVAVFIVLVAGVLVSAALAIRATDAERDARERLAEAEATVRFLDDMLGAADPSVMGKDVTVRAVLDQSARNIDAEFADQPLVKARLHSTVGRTYLALGALDLAPPHIETALSIRASSLGDDAPDTLRSVAEVGEMLYATGEVKSAEHKLTMALDELTRVLGREHEHTIYAVTQLAVLYAGETRIDEALPLLRESVRLNSAVHGPASLETLRAQSNLAITLTEAGESDEAEAILNKIIATASHTYAPDHPTVLSSKINLSWLCYINQRFEEAIRLGEESLKECRRVFGERHPETSAAMSNLAVYYRRAGRVDEAEPLYRDSLEISVESFGEEHYNTLISLTNFGAFLYNAGKHEQAIDTLERSLHLHRKVLGSSHVGTGHTLRFYAASLEKLGRHAEAEAAFLEAYEILATAHGPDYSLVQRIAGQLASFYDAQNNPNEAARWTAKATPKPPSDEPPDSAPKGAVPKPPR